MVDLNYILEIKAFYDWLEVNQLPTSAIALWHGLMHMANKTGWKDNFTVAVVVLEIKTGLKKQAIINARTILQNKELITFKSRGGNQSATYTINSLVSFKETQNDTQENIVSFKETQNDTQGHTQGHTQEHTQSHTQEHTINKQNKKKQNKTDNITPLPPSQGEPKETRDILPPTAKSEMNAIWASRKAEFSQLVSEKILEWLEYKKEIKKPYKSPKGFNTLLNQILKNIHDYGESAVIDVIDKTMANGYQGITWDRLEKTGGKNYGQTYGTMQQTYGKTEESEHEDSITRAIKRGCTFEDTKCDF